jgi:hypothetical protein
LVPSTVQTAIREMRLAELGGTDLDGGDAAGEITAGQPVSGKRYRERERQTHREQLWGENEIISP